MVHLQKRSNGKNEKIISIIQQLNGTEYISGPAARSYIDEDLFTNSNIKINWINYSKYPEYKQPWGEFAHDVSILDLLFCLGKEKASDFIWRKL